MRWLEVLNAQVAVMVADPVLWPILGDAYYKAGDRDLRVPAAEYTVVSDVEGERFNPIRFQWDIFVRTDAEAVAVERRMRLLFHRDMPIELAGVPLWAEFGGRREIEGLQDGIRGPSLDFVFTPVRSRYVRPVS